MCAYFLVILPLPSKSEVALLTTPRTQLIPFNFVFDFINNTSFNIANPSTYLKAITENCFFVPIYNILITIPFGIYLRYYFKCSFKKTVLFSFLLSLFFELTQLTGLYFIYPRGYRLFDVDDLFLNTLGGALGYFIAKPFVKLLPKRERIDEKAFTKGQKISGFKRLTSFILDLIIYSFLTSIIFLLTRFKYTYCISLVIYYVLIPYILKGSTFAEKFINLRIIDYKEKNNFIRLFLRKILFVLIYIGIPFLILFIMSKTVHSNIPELYIKIIFIVGFFIIVLMYIIIGIKYVFTNKPMVYEKISKTKMVSTIKTSVKND